MPNTSDLRITDKRSVPSPQSIIDELPCDSKVESLVQTTRETISNILHGKDKRLLAIVGPCSVHDPDSALKYGERLVKLRESLKDDIELVMRVYFEKPRTTVGWKGLINDPDLNDSFNINKGLRLARKLLLDINQLGLPAAVEFLDIVTGQYYSDLVSWGAIGARTTESQVHRELASGLSCPIGFKNGTSGNVQIAIDAVRSANSPHIFLSPTMEGKTGIYTTSGNQDAHVILRGGQTPNYDAKSVAEALEAQNKANINTGLIIDLSHANSKKQFEKQVDVGLDVADQIAGGNHSIAGIMLESHLVEGRQNVEPDKPLVYGQSITDACLGWDATEDLLQKIAAKTKQRQ